MAYLVLVWAIVVGKDGRETAELASVEDDSRFAADGPLLPATIASLFIGRPGLRPSIRCDPHGGPTPGRLSFVFGTGVLATTVNLVGSLYK